MVIWIKRRGKELDLKINEVLFKGNKNFTMKNEITLNSKYFTPGNNYDEHEFVELISSNNRILCQITFKQYESNVRAYLSPALSKTHDSYKYVIKKVKNKSFMNLYMANIDNVKNDIVEISHNIINDITEGKVNSGIIVLNKLNGYYMTLDKSNYKVDYASIDRIKLSVRQRKLLELDIPTYIAEMYLNQLNGSLSNYYTSEKDNVSYNNYYETSENIKYNLQNNNIPYISIVPIYSVAINNNKTINYYLKEKLLNYVLKIFIGQKKMQLRVIRPYPLDESDNTVRLSESAIKMMGLEETDSIIIRNGKYSTKARVLSTNDWSVISRENRLKSEEDLLLTIGISSHLRDSLKLDYINTNVTIERDLFFLFRKHLNKQMITLIGLFVSLPAIDTLNSLKIKISIFILLIIILVYLSFSDIREKLPKF